MFSCNELLGEGPIEGSLKDLGLFFWTYVQLNSFNFTSVQFN